MPNRQADVIGSYDIPICNKCKHYIGRDRCTAFKKIPNVILNAENNHSKPFKGDNGIQFEPIEDTDA